MRFEAGDRKGLQRYWDDALRMVERHPQSQRLRRLAEVLEIALLLHDAQVARVLQQLRAMMAAITDKDFDVEAAWGVLKRYEARIDDAPALAQAIQPLRTRYQPNANKPVIGDKAARQAGGVSLRVMDVKTVED